MPSRGRKGARKNAERDAHAGARGGAIDGAHNRSREALQGLDQRIGDLFQHVRPALAYRHAVAVLVHSRQVGAGAERGAGAGQQQGADIAAHGQLRQCIQQLQLHRQGQAVAAGRVVQRYGGNAFGDLQADQWRSHGFRPSGARRARAGRPS
jgi:hypothetical protein